MSSMDISSEQAIWDLINAQKKNRIILIAPQDMEEANTLATRNGLVSSGKLILSGTPC